MSAAEKSVPPQIFAAIAAVMGEVGAVGKTRENIQQKYKFRGIDEVLQAVQLVCAKHGVVVAQRILGPLRCEERKTQSGGQQAPLTYGELEALLGIGAIVK